MLEPTLNYVSCQGAAAQGASTHRVAYWEWNATGNPQHPHVIVCVHGLTRQGRDFDVLARYLSAQARVICPDVVGRGRSDWLADPMLYGLPQYTADMVTLLQQVHQQSPIQTLDWVGTSMGGLIGISLAGNPQLALPVPIRKLLLNDVGPTVEWPALQRIAAYIGKTMVFDGWQQAVNALHAVSTGFGPHTEAQWQALCRPMLRPVPGGGYQLHYDPAIAKPIHALTPELCDQGAEVLWALYDAIQAPTLLVRGAQSDLISLATARAMQSRGPQACYVELENVGHAPTFVCDDQVLIARKFLLGDE